MTDHCWNVARDGHQLDCPERREAEDWLRSQHALMDEAFRAELAALLVPLDVIDAVIPAPADPE